LADLFDITAHAQLVGTKVFVREIQSQQVIGIAVAISDSLRALMNTSGTGTRPRTASQARRAAAVAFHKGSVRSRRPLSKVRMLIDGRSTPSSFNLFSSDTRRPAQICVKRAVVDRGFVSEQHPDNPDVHTALE